MSIEKHLKITGSSEVSWKDAIIKTIDDVSKTIANISSITVLEQTAKINENKITEYFVCLDLKFVVDNQKRS